jgi:drug/metabolite transporter (DMT)-like permease
MGLGKGAIDAASYTTLRLASGAIMLSALAYLFGGRRVPWATGGWTSAGLLFAYAIAFSFAYISLGVGTGALILFGAVQVTMIASGLRAGERPGFLEWAGLAMALLGLVVLVFPRLSAPSPLGSLLMAVAGISWGLYSLRGRGSTDPLAATTVNFVRALPMGLAASLLALSMLHVTRIGALLAILSGAIASGCGYVVWYAALRHLTATRAAMVQLSVPVITAAAGVLFLSEAVTMPLVAASVLILGGIGLALAGKQRVRR